MEFEPVQGVPSRFPPGRMVIRLNQEHRKVYRKLYARYESILKGLPVLRERDFDGRAVRVTSEELEALNRALASFAHPPADAPTSAFAAQEAAKDRLFKRLQYLS